MWGVCVREVCVVVLEQILQLYSDERQSKKIIAQAQAQPEKWTDWAIPLITTGCRGRSFFK